jgi:SAM-dependent methyltransferase
VDIFVTPRSSQCWICDSADLQLAKASSNTTRLTSRNFSITDSHYGITEAIYRCPRCEFLQCSDITGVVKFYEELEDSAYEAGREERGLHAYKLLEVAKELQPGGRLLDVGAGSGMLVEQALRMGYRAEGIEPSAWLQKIAQQRGLSVHLGTFPHPSVTGRFEVITLIDVIEHVTNPVELLHEIAGSLSPGGIALIVTPDLDSAAARIMGWKWWHFRVAHIGYFNMRSLYLALDRAGLQPVFRKRPGWFFSATYLWERVHRYLPEALRLGPPRLLSKVVIPINLHDSWLVACRHKPQCSAANKVP